MFVFIYKEFQKAHISYRNQPVLESVMAHGYNMILVSIDSIVFVNFVRSITPPPPPPETQQICVLLIELI